MTKRAIVIAAALATCFMTSAASAADCTIDAADPTDLAEADVITVYDCLKDAMAEGYAKEGSEVGTAYRDWAITSTRPGVAGPHGNRYLQTFANDTAAEQYLKFEEEGVVMPVGSVLAKESFKVNKKQVAKTGPLFVMTKLEAGGAPEFGDWLYEGVQPNGKVMKVKQSFCHDCHSAWESQDALAYPLEEVRISN